MIARIVGGLIALFKPRPRKRYMYWKRNSSYVLVEVPLSDDGTGSAAPPGTRRVRSTANVGPVDPVP